MLVLISGAASVATVAAIDVWNSSNKTTIGIIEFDTNRSTTTAGIGAGQPLPKPISESKPVTIQVTNDMNGYSNSDFHFGLLFPNSLIAEEYRERDGGLTVSFQNPNTNAGFQVYATPYRKAIIDVRRFRIDEPSGVIRDPKPLTVEGAAGTMFFGYNAIMGDTRELWFIKGGYLYEVTTYKELDDWLAGIMQTWKFL